MRSEETIGMDAAERLGVRQEDRIGGGIIARVRGSEDGRGTERAAAGPRDLEEPGERPSRLLAIQGLAGEPGSSFVLPGELGGAACAGGRLGLKSIGDPGGPPAQGGSDGRPQPEPAVVFVFVCAWCEAEARQFASYREARRLGPVSHGICPRHLREQMAELAAMDWRGR